MSRLTAILLAGAIVAIAIAIFSGNGGAMLRSVERGLAWGAE